MSPHVLRTLAAGDEHVIDAVGESGRAGRRARTVLHARSRGLQLPRDAWLGLVRDRIETGAHVWIRVRGASMTPALPAGALARLGPLRAGGPRRGDVVLALLRSGMPVVHRVVATRGERVWLRGDAMPRRDPPTSRAAILARVTAVRIGGDEREPAPRRHWARTRFWLAALHRFVHARLRSLPREG